jgi:hypothetical protein
MMGDSFDEQEIERLAKGLSEEECGTLLWIERPDRYLASFRPAVFRGSVTLAIP